MFVNKKSGSNVGASEYSALPGSSCLGIQDDTTSENPCQVYTEDAEINERFYPQKSIGYLLANSYERLHRKDAKIERVRDCGSSLFFAHEIDGYGEIALKGKLKLANFCHDRLCPMCNWRRSLKIFGQVSDILDAIQDDYQFVFLTLTIPNVTEDMLQDTINRLIKSINRLFKRKRVKTVLRGYFRGLEITRNPVTDTFHPHFHLILALCKSYFQDYYYIRQDEWLQMWNEAYYGMDYLEQCVQPITQLDVRKCYDKRKMSNNGASISFGSSIAEAAKYAVKSSEYLHGDNYELTDRLVNLYSTVLYHRRLVQYGGIFLDTFKKLGLDDAEDENADLVHVNETINPAVSLLVRHFAWNVGISQYQFRGYHIEKGVNNEG